VNSPFKTDKPSRSGRFLLALDISAFGAREIFEARMKQIEGHNEARHARGGLELPEKTLADLRGEAARLGVVW